jgi:hypothetical protein
MKAKTPSLASALLVAFAGAALLSQDMPRTGYDDTPMIPGQPWRVHDGTRPRPRVVTPSEVPGGPPSDAVVLFDGKDLSAWTNVKGLPAGWKVENGYMEVVPKTGDIRTKAEFGDIQFHLEFRPMFPTKGSSQGRSNSGCFFMTRYEMQILDSYENPTYPDGQAGALYGQWPPLVNASRKPGEWQIYDGVFTAPRFKDGKVVEPATLTLFHNGVLLHNRKAFNGPTGHKIVTPYAEHGPKGPIQLQDHGDPQRFRNIWVRPLKDYDEGTVTK